MTNDMGATIQRLLDQIECDRLEAEHYRHYQYQQSEFMRNEWGELDAEAWYILDSHTKKLSTVAVA
ncbi:MAG: hypothetical protein KAT71_08170 [Gammaproteobacteria bacterium]|nr:hypothetical protein [Gammaproteobacteria bacterium]